MKNINNNPCLSISNQENTPSFEQKHRIKRKIQKRLVAGQSTSRYGLHSISQDLIHPTELQRSGTLKLISPKKPLKFLHNKKRLKRYGLKPQALHYSQESVSKKITGQHGEKVPLTQFCHEFKESGWMTDRTTGQLINPADVVYNEIDGLYITLDHRRVVAATLTHVQRVFVRIHDWEEELPVKYGYRFGGARTWGQAVRHRLNRQYTLRSPSPDLPHVNGLTFKERQLLGLDNPLPRFRSSSSLSSSSSDIVSPTPLSDDQTKETSLLKFKSHGLR